MGCCSRHSPPLERFTLRAWVAYLYSFRVRSSMLAQPPSQLSYLFVGYDRLISTSGPPAIL